MELSLDHAQRDDPSHARRRKSDRPAADLLQEIERRAETRPTTFTLLVPATSRRQGDWTLEEGLKAVREAARRPRGASEAHVDGLVGGPDAFEAIKRAVEEGDYDDIVISTLPKRSSEWLRKALPRRAETLGLPVAVITAPDPSRDVVMRFLLPDRPDGRDS